jgi:hypothetical protein
MSKQKVFEVERSDDEWVVRFKPGQFHLLPTETRKHVVGAGREALLAVRSILDSAISRAGDPPTPPQESTPENIAVQ